VAWTLTGSLDDYVATAGEFLRSHPVHNTIQLTALESLRARGASVFGDVAPLYGWWRSAAEVTAAMLHTPPYPVLLTGLPERSAGPLAEALAAVPRWPLTFHVARQARAGPPLKGRGGGVASALQGP
jgi:hypothetical protein